MKKLFDFFASYGFAVVLLILLTILTLFGTLEQAHSSLFDVQNKYFNSFFLVHYLFGVIPVPLPGVYLLTALLLVNLTCGGIIRARKDWRRPGMLIAHFGIIYMIFSGFVTYHFSTSGQMTLFPEQRSNQYASYYDWEISIAELKDGLIGRQWIIQHGQFTDMEPSDTREFFHSDLPFTLLIEGFVSNCLPVPAAGDEGVDGVKLQAQPRAMAAEQNMAGAYAMVLDKENQEVQNGILFGFALSPWVVTVQGRDYAIDLRHQTWDLPFTIKLDEFIRELHPRTGMASNFESVVTMTEGQVDRKINIRMNEPLRHKGYTFFQASWGPQNARPGDPLFSTFAVVNNPADQWPLYSCIVIAVGLTIHFMQKLVSYLRAENRRRTA
ncbi:MAG: cytochrome c biogenesis protein ResB [Candidatus Hydrogenedentes bacterium]|nr:cytochrome c biogenesis protein ResB [Candidatus Hydrogenedentota bacterium]